MGGTGCQGWVQVPRIEGRKLSPKLMVTNICTNVLIESSWHGP